MYITGGEGWRRVFLQTEIAEKMVGKTEIIQKPTAAGNGNLSTANRKFVNHNLAGNGYCLILSQISFD